MSSNSIFQSTLPARGATSLRLTRAKATSFQSTLPARGATHPNVYWLRPPAISIHAPRTGSDGAVVGAIVCSVYFNPRSPHGERPDTRWFHDYIYGFQSTLPARGATRALRRGHLRVCHFNPRSPHGERRWKTNDCFAVGKFQSTLPARGATRSALGITRKQADFNPRSPHGERPLTVFFPTCGKLFQSTLPARGATNIILLCSPLITISIHAPRTGSDPNYIVKFLTIHISIHAPRTGSD